MLVLKLRYFDNLLKKKQIFLGMCMSVVFELVVS